MVRGGSWYDGPSDLRSANRFSYVAAVRISGIGFRLARTLTP